jgi:hypothetical protein
MAWEEWEQLKATATERRSANMQLNHAAPVGGGGAGAGEGDLVVHQDELGAVGHDAFMLHDKLGKQSDIAGAGMDKQGAGSTMQAAATLKSHNFATGSLLELAVEMWTTQSKSLLQACAHISNHLDYTKKLHAHDDARIGAELRSRDGSAVSVSRLNDYFK